MATIGTPSSRKRGRPRNEETDQASSAKKPRLTASASSKSTPVSLRSLASAISGSFGYGERRVSTNGTIKKGRQPVDKTCEVPDSDEERKNEQLNKSKNISGSAAKRSIGKSNDIYDFHDLDGASSPVHTPSRKTRSNGSAATERSPTAHKQNGIGAELKPPTQGSGRGTRSTGPRTYSRKKCENEILSGRLNTEDAPEDGEDVEEGSDSEDVLTPVAVRSSVTRVRSSRKPDQDPPKLKGILTPSKKLRERNLKSVAFDEHKSQAAEVYFDDLPSKPAQSSSLPRGRPAQGKGNMPADNVGEKFVGSEEEDDDEVCAICSKPDSKPPNEILFCDNCDLAVHQKCYGVAKIPKGDWWCKGCTQDPSSTSQSSGLKGTGRSASAAAAVEVAPDIPNFGQHLRFLQRVLLDRCTGRRRIRLRHQDEAYEKTLQLVEQTILAGEGNSMLIIGARGCGKTTMVNSVLCDLGLEHKNEFHVVRLNGFIHTDDKVALKDIWRQLGKEMEVEDDLIGKTNNYADTLASLLALLSHPSEIAETQDGITSKSVVFIIDEFDLFAAHARQTLLYNLFDVAQARKAPIAVLGLTNRIDVVESLEKRVKSRFSHRYVYLSLSKTLPAYWEICKQGLSVDDEDSKAEGLAVSLKGFTKFQDYWAEKIEMLYKDQTFKDHLEYHYFSTKSVPAFLHSCALPLAALSPTNLSFDFSPQPSVGLAIDAPDSKLHLLESLSELDLSLLISAARLDIVAHTDTVNFAMVYDEYTTLIGRQRVQSATSGMLALGGGFRVWGRGVAEISWERLVSLGLLLPTGLGGRSGLGYGGVEGRMWKVDVTLEEIPLAVKLNAVLTRWCKEI